ncbi:MAG TPA: alpha/beta fold hydrolase [Flavitalea sp.]|nr:alpha/beta fold hydrolase [Flavitalea sp.]
MRYGTGSRYIFCFHGYGETADTFSFLYSHLLPGQTLIAIDLPFHGKTDWKEGIGLGSQMLAAIMEEISGTNHPPYILIGYSLGGRIALHYCQDFPERIKKLVLLAPDGLKLNPWYWFATQTRMGSALFSFTVQRPAVLSRILNTGHHLNLVNSSIYKFVRQHLHRKEVRSALYARWMCMRFFRPDLRRVRSLITQHNISIRLLYGAHDRMIRPSRGEKFRKGIESFCTLQVIDSGHGVLDEKNVQVISHLIQS